MKTMREIVEDIKDIISNEVIGKVQDNNVADVLGTTRGALATAKSRNVIMYQNISEFCAKRSIAINFLLFGQLAESLIQSTNRFELKRYDLASQLYLGIVLFCY